MLVWKNTVKAATLPIDLLRQLLKNIQRVNGVKKLEKGFMIMNDSIQQ